MRNRGVNDPTWRAGKRPAPRSGSFTPRFLVSLSVAAMWADDGQAQGPPGLQVARNDCPVRA